MQSKCVLHLQTKNIESLVVNYEGCRQTIPGEVIASDKSIPANIAAPTVETAIDAKRVPGTIGISSIYCALPDVCRIPPILGIGSETGYSEGSVVKDCDPDEIGRTNGTAADCTRGLALGRNDR